MALFHTDTNLEEYISRLEDDIKRHGIFLPPRVTKVKEKDKHRYHHKEYLVMQGNHRCEVAQRLGWKEIECEVVDG